MREVQYLGPVEEAAGFDRQFHQEVIREESGKEFFGRLGHIYEIQQGANKYLVASYDGVSKENLENSQKIAEANELIRETIDMVYPILVADFCASGLGCTESELQDHYISKQDMLERFLLIVDIPPSGDNSGQTCGRYDSRSHRYAIYLDRYLKNDGQISTNFLVTAFVHELLHFVSKSAVTLEVVQEKKVTKVVSGEIYSQSGYHEYSEGGINRFAMFNEGVTQLYALELSKKILAAMGQATKTPEARCSIVYQREIAITKRISSYLAEHFGVSKAVVWKSWKSGYLTGDVLGNSEVRRGLAECFGDDFIDNFLADLGERNPVYFLTEEERLPEPRWSSDLFERERQKQEHGAAIVSKILEKRWQANGGKKVK